MFVLILVLVEDGLRANLSRLEPTEERRLNPCSCGGWSQRYSSIAERLLCEEVLILVLVEDGLRGSAIFFEI